MQSRTSRAVGLVAALGLAGCISTGGSRGPGVDSLGTSTGDDGLTLGSLVTGFADSTTEGSQGTGSGGTTGGSTDDEGSTSGDTSTRGSSGSAGDGTDASTGTTGEEIELPPWCGALIPVAGADPLIDDLEVEMGQMLPDDQIPAIDGRVGFWFTYNDESMGGVQSPIPGSFQPSPGGAEGTAYAAVTTGSGFNVWGAGMGVKLNNDFSGDCPYDGSSYDGVSFWARGDVAVRMSVTVRATLPIENGGTCDPDAGQCSDHFGLNLVLTPQWQLYTVTWDELAQQGWGTPAAFDPGKLIELQWQAPVALPFDVQIDEVNFWSR